VETRELLVALREEADEIAGLCPGSRLEDIFNGQMLCHFDNAANPSPYSFSRIPVIIRKLATTRHAADASVTSEESLVRPALDAIQMDSFIDRQICDVSIGDFSSTDVGILKSSLLVCANFSREILSRRLSAVPHILQYCSIGIKISFSRSTPVYSQAKI
jgi:hypothetical protein